MKTQLMLFDRDYPTLTANMSELRSNKEVTSHFSTSSKRLAKSHRCLLVAPATEMPRTTGC